MNAINATLPFVSLAVSLASFVWSLRLWHRQIEIEAEAAARGRLIAAGWVAPDATPRQALDAFRAERPLLGGKGEG